MLSISYLSSLLAFFILFQFTNLSESESAKQNLFNGDPATNPYFWGTWRPNLYFGLRTLSPKSILAGLMWFRPQNLETLSSLRHDCKEDDRFESYGFDIHNGLDFAKQTIKDPFLNTHLTVEWIKTPGGSKGGDWIARIKGKPLNPVAPLFISLFFYAGFESEVGKLGHSYETKTSNESQFLMFKGEAPSLGEFSMHLHLDPSSKAEAPRITSIEVPVGSLWKIKEILQSHFTKIAHSRTLKDGNDPSIYYFQSMPRINSGNTVISQLTFQNSFQFDVSFVSADAHKNKDLSEVAYELSSSFRKVSMQKEDAFDARFESIFQLRKHGYNQSQVKMGKYALSNLIGGIGFFTGVIQVDDSPEMEEEKFNAFYYPQEEDEEENFISYQKKIKNVRLSSPETLFTATPSRSFFPRGFLWDEGFHQTIITSWDPELSKHCLSSWFDRMDENGWIAREQILGKEAESKVPDTFRVQSSHIANPPTLNFAVAKLMRAEAGNISSSNILKMEQINQRIRTSFESPYKSFAEELFPKFERQFGWFQKTQFGISNQFKRKIENGAVFRWRGRTANHNFASGLDDYPRSNPPHIGELHVDLMAWMREYAAFLEDMSHLLGKDPEKYRTFRESIESNIENHFFDPAANVFADLKVSFDETKTEFEVNKGYISLLPWCLNLDLRGSLYESGIQLIKELMTDYGIASLHPLHPNFRQGENYWRGNVWINFQYLTLRALFYHQSHDAIQAGPLYTELRQKVINNLSKQFSQTGFLFETYDVMNGEGSRSRPFTGWSSLILLIMSEIY